MEGTIALGIKITSQVLAIEDHDQLLDKMAGCLHPFRPLDASIKASLSTGAQKDRREDLNHTPNDKDDAEGVDSMPFPGDTVAPTGPPLAWVLLWDETYVNIYGEYVPEPLKASGWVMWDEHRLNSTGVKKAIADQWKAVPELIEEIQDPYPWLGPIWGNHHVELFRHITLHPRL